MKCRGNFVFKTLTHRAAGAFKNADGIYVNYPAAYILKVDETTESGEINEHKFKIDEKNKMLVEFLKTLESYQRVIIEFNVTLYSNRIGFEVVNVEEN